MRRNLDRALNGVDLAHAATGADATSLAPEDYEAGLVDALANLMHMARRYEIDFESALDQARRRHGAEARFPWDAVPDAAELCSARAELAELVTSADIGRRLGVTRQRAHQLSQTVGFPPPLGKVGNYVVFSWPAVERWSRRVGRTPSDETPPRAR